MQINMTQEEFDKLSISYKAELIVKRAHELKKNNKTINIKKAYKIAEEELFLNKKYNY